MENIVYNTTEMEHKERDYVKLQFRYDENELHSAEEVEKRFKKHQAKNIPIPDIPGVTTAGGKLVIVIVEEKMARFIRQSVTSLVEANEEVKSKFKDAPPPRPSRKAAPAKKPAKPTARPKTSAALKPARKSAAAAKKSKAGRKR